MKEDMNSLRCKACDTLFAPVYYEDEGRFEECCNTCLQIALGYSNYVDDAQDFIDVLEGNLQIEE